MPANDAEAVSSLVADERTATAMASPAASCAKAARIAASSQVGTGSCSTIARVSAAADSRATVSSTWTPARRSASLARRPPSSQNSA